MRSIIRSSGLEQCVQVGLEAMDWYNKRGQMNPDPEQIRADPIRRGIGMAVMLHGSGIAGLDMAAATIKMNDDGSFNLLIGATDLGTGSDTILAQMAAEVLGIPVEDLIVYSSDTDFTPFDKGAYASSTTYISGGAVRKAAHKVAGQIKEHAATMLGLEGIEGFELRDRQVFVPDGRALTLEASGPEQPAPAEPAPDHRQRLPRELRQPAALRRPVCRAGGGYRDRTGHRGAGR